MRTSHIQSMQSPSLDEETSSQLSRRGLLRGALAVWLPGAAGLSGCGGGSSPASATAQEPLPPTPPPSRPLVTLRRYASSSMTFSETVLEGPTSGISTAADRFASGWCRAFSGASSTATVENLPSFADGDFAVSCWIRTGSRTTARLLRFTDASARQVLSIESSEAGNLAVLSSETVPPLLMAGSPAEWADGQWHHLLVQQTGQTVQLCLNGIVLATQPSAVATATPATLQLGGGWIGDIDDVRLHTRAFSASEVASMVYVWQQLRQTNTAGSMPAYYPFYGNAKNNTGRGNDGVVNRAQLTTNRFGDHDGAYQFNGVDASIELLEGFGTYEQDYAIAFWFSTSSTAALVALSASSPRRTVDFVVNGSAGLSLHIGGESAFALTAGIPGQYADSAWHFVLAQRQGAALQLHIDGVLLASRDDGLPLLWADGSMAFGRGSSASPVGPGYWDGKLDDIQVYSRSFTLQDIRLLEALQFRPVDGAAALTFNNRLWLLGGWRSDDDMSSTHSEVWSSADGILWSLATVAPWEGRHTFGALVFDGRMWVIGGDRNRGYYQSDVWSSRDGVSWDLVAETPSWAGRANPYTLVFNNKMWLMGGVRLFEPPENQGAYNDVYSSRDGANWTLETASAPWSPRGLILGSVVYRGRMWLLGGGQYDQRSFLNDVWSSADGIHWDLVSEQAPWSGRQYQNVAVFDGKMWIIAGADVDHRGGTTDVWFSVDGIDWVQLESNDWHARHAASVFVLGNTLWLLGGSDTKLFNDVWSLSYAP